MAWHLSLGRVEAGQTTSRSFYWGDEELPVYNGIQALQARAIPQSAGGVVIIGPADVRILEQGVVLRRRDSYYYSVVIRNYGPWSAEVELIGKKVG